MLRGGIRRTVTTQTARLREVQLLEEFSRYQEGREEPNLRVCCYSSLLPAVVEATSELHGEWGNDQIGISQRTIPSGVLEATLRTIEAPQGASG